MQGLLEQFSMETIKSLWNTNSDTTKTIIKSAITTTGVIGTYLAARYIYDRLSRKCYNYPPGPTGYPLFGSGLEFGKDARQFFKHLSAKDKKISMFYMIYEPWIVIHDLSIAKKHFTKIEFSNRPDHEASSIWTLRSILNSSYKDAHLRRQVMVQALISQAQRSRRLYQLIGKAIEIDMFNGINNCIKNKRKWDIRNEARFVVFCTIYASTIGESIDVKDKTFLEFVDATQDFFASWAGAVLVDSITPSWISKNTKIGFPGIIQFRQAQIKMMNIVQKWTKEKISKVNQDIENGIINIDLSGDDDDRDSINNDNGNNNNLKDDYIRELVILSKKENIGVESMLSDIVVAFFAGTHTTATAIEQGVLYLAQNPGMQERIYDQLIKHKLHLKENYGNIKLLHKCAVLKAFVYETLRFNGVVLASVQRTTNVYVIDKNNNNTNNNNNEKELQLKYYDENSQSEKYYNIPQNGTVVMNLWQMMTQSGKFGDNEFKFDLNNWLIEDDNNNINDNNVKFNDSKFLPVFGYGNRNCAGQILAKNELYLVLGLLIINYKFIPPNNIKPENFQIPFAFENPNEPLGVECEKRHRLQ